ncbi:MAG: M50 family metallopeptidase, partial [Myxococcota bacterium]
MLLISAVVTLILYNVPFLYNTIAYPLLLISTMVHELGHGVAALLSGGSFAKFVMFPDGSGMAYIGTTGR